MTNKRLKQYYKTYNRKYFGSALPDVVVRFATKEDKIPRRMLGGASWRLNKFGVAYYYRILVARTVGNVITLQTLLHEMIHVKIGHRYNHGPRFKKELKRLFNLGAYNNLL